MSHELDFDPRDDGADLAFDLKQLGFTVETHPDLLRDMMRMFKEACAHAGVNDSDHISCLFMFDDAGVTGAIVTPVWP